MQDIEARTLLKAQFGYIRPSVATFYEFVVRMLNPDNQNIQITSSIYQF